MSWAAVLAFAGWPSLMLAGLPRSSLLGDVRCAMAPQDTG
jgi:hypothetical protein